MTFPLSQVAHAIGAVPLAYARGSDQSRDREGAVSISGWSIDSRTLAPGDLYFALRGPHFDGHDFAAAAIERGAAAVVAEHALLWTAPSRSRLRSEPRASASGSGIAPNLAVGDLGAPWELLAPDTLQALQDLGRWARREWGGSVVGVTGSAGKTTTKDAIAHLLSVELATGRTVGNFNNHVGVPLSILRLPGECRVGVLEMGMNHAGEIRELASIALPQVGVVTNVGYAHVEFFDSIEGVAAAKRELIEALPRDGVAVLNADDPRVARFGETHPGRTVTFGFSERAAVRAENVEYSPEGARFRALGVDYETGMTGRHAISNLLAALAVAQVFDIAPERLRDAVRTFSAGKMRGERIAHRGMVVWNDCYNSNPEAAQAMIDVLVRTPARRRIAVMGEMLELGHASEQLHRKLGRYVASANLDRLVGVRGDAHWMTEEAIAAGMPEGSAPFFDDPAEAGEWVRGVAEAGDALLFKGSRGVRVERALERFLS